MSAWVDLSRGCCALFAPVLAHPLLQVHESADFSTSQLPVRLPSDRSSLAPLKHSACELTLGFKTAVHIDSSAARRWDEWSRPCLYKLQVVGVEVPRLAMASDQVPGRMVGALARVCRHAEFGGFLEGRSEGSLGKQHQAKAFAEQAFDNLR